MTPPETPDCNRDVPASLAAPTGYAAGDVTEADVEAVEAEIGMGSGAWDCVNPREIIAAAWSRLAKLRWDSRTAETRGGDSCPAHGLATVEGLNREQFGQLPRGMQWALAGKYGVPRVARVRDARQERISWSLGKTPGGTGGDPAPHSFYTDDRDLFDEIVRCTH